LRLLRIPASREGFRAFSRRGHEFYQLQSFVSEEFSGPVTEIAVLDTLAGMRPQSLICVTDVEASSSWYQRLLGCRSAHGGQQYEQLARDGSLILQLHSFEVEHHHGPIGNRADKPYGNGVLLWFEVEDFDAVMRRAAEMKVEMILPRHRNPPDGDGGPNHWECWMRDPDGYTVVVASPYGTADGTWQPGPDLFT
jgi:catechol 2,3-dioxygenase-like lactoylglutathione lyase family enzyme